MVSTKPPLEEGGVAKQGHVSHVFSGWADFVNHIRSVHGLEPLKDDGETWLIHDSLHGEAGGAASPTTTPRPAPSEES